jgi:predicted TIM-barrel fold metal-dependent hydrolase
MSVITPGREAPSARRKEQLAIVDCDVHTFPPTMGALDAYMPQRWRGYASTLARGYSGSTLGKYPRVAWIGSRHDARPADGSLPGSDLGMIREQLLDMWNIEYAVMTPVYAMQTNFDYAAVVARAFNDWQLEFLDAEPRLRGSITISYEDGPAAAAEIRRAAADKRFVQVLAAARTLEPLGRRKYWPIYEACVEHGLPIAFHYGGQGNPTTGAGWPYYYFEDHGGMSMSLATQATSFVFEGVLDRFPTLKVVLVEGGFAWIKPLFWRMDKAYDTIRGDVQLQRKPSEYFRDHFWLTTQPMEEPTNAKQFPEIIADIGADKLMFASDYPHWDFDAPDMAFPARIDDAVKRRIMGDNARALYGLGVA